MRQWVRIIGSATRRSRLIAATVLGLAMLPLAAPSAHANRCGTDEFIDIAGIPIELQIAFLELIGPDWTDAFPCEPCPLGSVPLTITGINGEPSTPVICQTCAAGQIADAKTGTCVSCPGGTFTGDSISCHTCPAGTSSGAGSALCMACTKGTVSSSGGSCAACAAGTYAIGGLLCKKCGPGHISAAGADSCAACLPGMVSNASHTACSCQSGNSIKGPLGCMPCPPKQVANASQTSCTPCPAGTTFLNGACLKISPTPKFPGSSNASPSRPVPGPGLLDSTPGFGSRGPGATGSPFGGAPSGGARGPAGIR